MVLMYYEFKVAVLSAFLMACVCKSSFCIANLGLVISSVASPAASWFEFLFSVSPYSL